MKYKYKYKIGQKVLLRDDAEHSHQKHSWYMKDEGWATITEAYISGRGGGPWYRIKAVSGYTNSYPETDLDPFGFDSNREAKKLLSKEW